MIARSIHPIPAPPAEEPEPEASQSHAVALRRRTNDPAREYAQRPGAVESLPNSVAALILCKKGWAKIERHQIKITHDGEDLVFASRDSVIIAAKNGTGERVLWAVNRRAPELLHLLTNDGRYIESVPRKGEAQWFSQDEASRDAYADAQAMIQRDAARLRELHTPDTAAAARDAQHNAAEVHRLIQTFPAPTTDRNRAEATAPEGRGDLFPKAEELVTAMRAGVQQRERHVANEAGHARNARAAREFGAVLRQSTPEAAPEAAPVEAEVWPDPAHSSPNPNPQPNLNPDLEVW